MDTLREGQRHLHVYYMQGLLNKALITDRVRATPLKRDHRFGPKTSEALKAFQRRRHIAPDGICGPITWGELGHRLEFVHHHIRQFGQPTNMTCWSAAATIILGNQSVGSGASKTYKDGSLKPTMENIQAFANSLGWRMLNMTPTVAVLRDIVRQSPVWIAARHSNGGHVVVLSGVYGQADGSPDGTCFRVHDPWPPNVGTVYCSFADPLTFHDERGKPTQAAALDFVLVPP